MKVISIEIHFQSASFDCARPTRQVFLSRSRSNVLADIVPFLCRRVRAQVCKIVMILCNSARKFVNTAWIDHTWRFVDLAHFGFGTSLAFFFIISILFLLLISVKQQHLIIMILVMWDVQYRSSFAYNHNDKKLFNLKFAINRK